MTPFGISGLLAGVSSLGFGLFVLLKSSDRRLARIWFAFSLSVAGWGVGIGMMVHAPSYAQADFWMKWVLYPGANLIPVLFLHFVFEICEIKFSGILVLGYILAFLLQTLTLTGYMVSMRTQPPFEYFSLPLKWFWLFDLNFFGAVLYAHVLLIQRLFTASERQRNQIKFVLLGMSIGFLGGSTAFFFAYGVPIFPYGVYLVPIYIVMVSYAIFKHQLMDINMVIRKTLLYSLVSASLAAIYVGTITLMAHVFGGRHGSASAVSSALAAISITLLFNPLRVRIQRFVDRYFFREAMDQAMLREATSGFVHEIKRPLANISLPTQLTLMDIQDLRDKRRSLEEILPKIEQRLQYVLDQTMDAGNKIEAIREFSNTNGNPLESVDVTEIIQKSVASEISLLRRHQVEVKLDLAISLAAIQGRAKQLEIVFSNLIKNAAEAMSKADPVADRFIWIKAVKSNGRIVISVKDSGPGISKNNVAHLFEPYFTTKGAQGMGMGLYLCRQIVQAHHGSIMLASENGKGAEFILSFLATT